MLDDFEFNPMSAGAGLLGGVLSQVVMAQMQPNILIRIIAFVFTTIACYFVFSKITNQ